MVQLFVTGNLTPFTGQSDKFGVVVPSVEGSVGKFVGIPIDDVSVGTVEVDVSVGFCVVASGDDVSGVVSVEMSAGGVVPIGASLVVSVEMSAGGVVPIGPSVVFDVIIEVDIVVVVLSITVPGAHLQPWESTQDIDIKSYLVPRGQVLSTIFQFLHSKYLLQINGLGILIPKFRHPFSVGGGFGSYLQHGAKALKVQNLKKQL